MATDEEIDVAAKAIFDIEYISMSKEQCWCCANVALKAAERVRTLSRGVMPTKEDVLAMIERDNRLIREDRPE